MTPTSGPYTDAELAAADAFVAIAPMSPEHLSPLWEAVRPARPHTGDR